VQYGEGLQVEVRDVDTEAKRDTLRVLFLTPYFPPEIGAPQSRIYELALRLHKKGHRVSVLTTFPNYPSGIVPKEWRGRLFWKGQLAGVSVYRTWSYPAPNIGFLRRILNQVSFAVSSCIAGFFLPRTDVIIVESPPLLDGLAGAFLSAYMRAPFILNVADLWVDAAVQMGAVRSGPLIKFCKFLESYSYHRAAQVFAVTPGVRQAIVDSGVPKHKVILLPNAVDTDFFAPMPIEADALSVVGKKAADFLVMYAGTLGMAQQIETIVDTAATFQQEGNTAVQFVFLGDGAERQNLERKATHLGLRNVRFLGTFPKSQMPALLGAADCVLVSIRDLKVLEAALPTKVLEAMSCAKPVVLAARGDAADVMAAAGAGLCVQPGDPVAIRDAVIELARQPERRRSMGENGRAYVVKNFSREQRAEELHEVLMSFRESNSQYASDTEMSSRKCAL
jgi:glycosyltransferase involved in cell wall biosynthesis